MQLSPQRTFVVQLSDSSEILSGYMVGRIEHVVSHQAAEFNSLDTLVAFIAAVLASSDETAPVQDIGCNRL